MSILLYTGAFVNTFFEFFIFLYILLNFIVPVPIFIEFAIDISFILYPSIKCCLSIFISLLVKIFFKSSKANCSSYATASYVSNSHSGIGIVVQLSRQKSKVFIMN